VALVRTAIEKVTVYGNHFTVEFKSGLETDIDGVISKTDITWHTLQDVFIRAGYYRLT